MLGIENIVVGAFRLVYRRVPARPLGTRRPRLSWFPKYRTPVRIPPAILSAEDPDAALGERLEAMGFQLDAWTKETIRFVRGKSWGDFSVRLIRLELSFPHPLGPESFVQLEVATVCLLDTGDLWTVCQEVVERVEAPGNDEEEP